MTGADAAGGPPTTRARRALRRSARVLPAWIVAVLAGAAALLLPAGPASAHAAMVAAAPAAGSIVAASPTEVSVVFSEPVTPVPGRVQVLAPDGTRISGAARAQGTVLRIPVRRADHPLGTYLVSYRVVSADSHPVGGALTFSVGAPSARPAEPPAAGVHPSVAVAVPAARFLGYAGLALAVGPTLLLALLWPRRMSRRGPIRLAYTGLGLLAAGTLAGLWVQAPNSSGDPLWRVSPGELGEVLASPYGLALTARLAVLAIVGALLPPVLRGTAGRGRALAVTGLALAALVTWPLTGHAVAAPLAGAVAAADVVHLAAMAVWLGGLATLTVFLLPRAHPRVLGVLLPAWSRWAALAVVWLVGGGVVQAVVQVGSVPALWRTDHGRLLLAKIAVLAVTLGAAAYARRLVRRDPAAGVSRLRRAVALEAVATCVVLGLSAVLVQATPGRSVAAERAAESDTGVSQTLSCPLFTLQFNVYPVEVGENNTVHAFVYTPAGAPLPAEEWTITTRLAGTDIEPVRTPMLPLVPRHHAVGALTFPLPGTYEVRFTVRTSDIDQGTVTTTITVPGAGPRR
ncbi:copper resistance protein CopC [Krasilnikovia sp. MM14-A1259]|uniref:copper resistance CopC/CopD family protein n=1 Tax=Krasilnikovia sp. MM14-A1259 TaxID=3373539 RepID=UPI00399D0EFC